MAMQSNIEWTDITWNPIAGCSIVSPGCTNCYAMRMASRLQSMGIAKYEGTTRKSGKRHVWTGRINVEEGALALPLEWRKPKRIFVNSMSDLFQDGMQDGLVLKIWRTMKAAHWHTFQILTKRPENMLRLLSQTSFSMLPNVWLGTSIENGEHIHRLDVLKHIPAYVRFVSFEPLLGPIPASNLDGIHWAIVGGESGPNARPMERWWVEDLRDSCKQQGIAFFFKQWGGVQKKVKGRLLQGRYWNEYPKVLAVA